MCGAGDQRANGLYLKTDETYADHPVWRNDNRFEIYYGHVEEGQWRMSKITSEIPKGAGVPCYLASEYAKFGNRLGAAKPDEDPVLAIWGTDVERDPAPLVMWADLKDPKSNNIILHCFFFNF